MNWHAILAVLACGAAATFVGGWVTKLVFRAVDNQAASAEQRRERDDPDGVEGAAAILRGGAWIGVLERITVFSALCAGWPEALALVVALKGLGRYPELRGGTTSAVAERFIIGTFVSMLWAAGWAGVAVWAR